MNSWDKLRIYVASSWRNQRQPGVVSALRELGHDVYDFKNPAPGNAGFAWSSIDPDWKSWSPARYAAALDHPLAVAGFKCDIDALHRADLVVLVLPSGRSASWEYGYHCGSRQRPGIVYIAEEVEPELMYRGSIFVSYFEQLEKAVFAWKCHASGYIDNVVWPKAGEVWGLKHTGSSHPVTLANVTEQHVYTLGRYTPELVEDFMRRHHRISAVTHEPAGD